MISLPINSQYYRKNEKPLSHSLELFGSRKRSGDEEPNVQCFCPASPPIPMARLRSAAPCAGGSAAVTDEYEERAIQLPEELRPELMPKHVAVISDGNGRWAESRGLQVQFGHRAALETLKNLAFHCCEFGIKVLTVFVFSTENWKRSQAEVDFLLRCLEGFIRLDVMELTKGYNVRFSVIGNKTRLPKSLQSAISSAEEAGHANRGLQFLMALNYGGRHEIAEACKKIAIKVEDGVLRAQDIDESLLDQQMMTSFADFPNPDLIIRTSGEMRVSNFLLWQLAYAEFYFATKMFPDFGKADLVEALTSFQRRKRRYGKRPN